MDQEVVIVLNLPGIWRLKFHLSVQFCFELFYACLQPLELHAQLELHNYLQHQNLPRDGMQYCCSIYAALLERALTCEQATCRFAALAALPSPGLPRWSFCPQHVCQPACAQKDKFAQPLELYTCWLYNHCSINMPKLHKNYAHVGLITVAPSAAYTQSVHINMTD